MSVGEILTVIFSAISIFNCGWIFGMLMMKKQIEKILDEDE